MTLFLQLPHRLFTAFLILLTVTQASIQSIGVADEIPAGPSVSGGANLSFEYTEERPPNLNEVLTEAELEFLRRHVESLADAIQAMQEEFVSLKEVINIWKFIEGNDHVSSVDPERARLIQRYQKARDYLKDWRSHFEFRRLFYRAFHYHWMDSSTHIRESVRDMVFLFSLSHTPEVVIGLTSGVLALFGIISWKVGGPLLAIVLPFGVDPLCWILIGSYVVSHWHPWLHFWRRTVRTIRIKTFEKISTSEGLRNFFSRFFYRESALDWLTQTLERHGPGEYELHRSRESVFLKLEESIGTHRDPFSLRLLFRRNRGNTLALVSAEYLYPEGVELRELVPFIEEWLPKRGWVNPLQYNLLLALRNKDLWETSKAPPQVTEFLSEPGAYRVAFEPGAVHLGTKTRRVSKRARSGGVSEFLSEPGAYLVAFEPGAIHLGTKTRRVSKRVRGGGAAGGCRMLFAQ